MCLMPMRGDEIGDIAKATEVFKQSIAEKVINLRVRSALDVVRSNVMVADGDYNIMYMNTTLQEMMQEAESGNAQGAAEFRRPASCSAPTWTCSTRIPPISASCWIR